MKKLNKRQGFTLIELVIVVAIIGILALMIIPQFNNVTKDAKEKTFRANHRTIVSAIAMYQAGNNGDLPANLNAVAPYLGVKISELNNNPTGSTYTISNGVLTSTWSDSSIGANMTLTYPENSSN